MISLLLKITGWLLATAPEWLLRPLAAVLGDAVFLAAGGRRRLMLSNLSHAFPERPAAWRRKVAQTCFRRFAETGMLSLATPFFPERRIRAMARLSPAFEEWLRARAAAPRPTVFGTLHLALWESQAWFTLLCPPPAPEFGIIYRPLDNAQADNYLRRARERFGMRFLSRKEGFATARDILRRNGCVGLLFDQNAGMQGCLTLLLDRVCSTSELPGLLACRHAADLRTVHPRRTGFWRVVFETDAIAHDGTPAGATLALNRWLENSLRDEAFCSGWFWVHDRWRHQDVPARRFRLESKRNLLAADLAARGLAKMPRRTRIWVRLPNWLGDVVMTLPLLRALRESRPDAAITLVALPQFAPLLASWGVADAIHPLPAKGPLYFFHFLSLRCAYPDVWLLFTNSLRGDLEARLAGAPQRFGLVRPGHPRPLLSHGYSPPADFDPGLHHQLEGWEALLRHFGLESPPDRRPTAAPPAGAGLPIALIPGSENEPLKRWPVSGWRALIEGLPKERFVVLGTAGDLPIARAVSEGFDPARVENLAGKTDLPGLAARLRGCRLLVTNDTGGMHLANSTGVPLVALFGPTNPFRTGPVFAAPCTILQPPGCPPTGGGSLADLTPETVIAAVNSH